MPTLRYQNRMIELTDDGFAAVKNALDAFVRGVSMDTYLDTIPPEAAEMVNSIVKDLSMQAFAGGTPGGYTHRWRGLVKNFLESLGNP